MITFLFFNSLMFYLYKDSVSAKKTILLVYILALVIFVFKLFEVGFNITDYFISDENTYFNEYNYYIFIKPDERLLWYLINFGIQQYDVLGLFFIKLINIPIGLLMIRSISKSFSNKIPDIYYALLLPYWFLIFTLNIRDLLILYVSIELIYTLGNYSVNKICKIMLLCLLIFLLRPLFLVLIFFIFSMFYFVSNKHISFQNKMKLILLVLLLVLLFYAIFRTKINAIVTSYFYNIVYNFSVGYSDKVASFDEAYKSTGNVFYDFIYNCFRFIVTPLPTSLFKRVLFESNSWGYIDDVVRIINQSFYFYFLFYCVYNVKLSIQVLRKMDNVQKSILMFLFAHLPIYSFYLLGLVHQRTKLPFQLIFLIIYFFIKIEKKRNCLESKFTSDFVSDENVKLSN